MSCLEVIKRASSFSWGPIDYDHDQNDDDDDDDEDDDDDGDDDDAEDDDCKHLLSVRDKYVEELSTYYATGVGKLETFEVRNI